MLWLHVTGTSRSTATFYMEGKTHYAIPCTSRAKRDPLVASPFQLFSRTRRHERILWSHFDVAPCERNGYLLSSALRTTFSKTWSGFCWPFMPRDARCCISRGVETVIFFVICCSSDIRFVILRVVDFSLTEELPAKALGVHGTCPTRKHSLDSYSR